MAEMAWNLLMQVIRGELSANEDYPQSLEIISVTTDTGGFLGQREFRIKSSSPSRPSEATATASDCLLLYESAVGPENKQLRSRTLLYKYSGGGEKYSDVQDE